MAEFNLEMALNGAPLITRTNLVASNFKLTNNNHNEFKYVAIIGFVYYYYNAQGISQKGVDYDLLIGTNVDIATKSIQAYTDITIRDAMALNLMCALIGRDELSLVKKLLAKSAYTINANTNVTVNNTNNITVEQPAVQALAITPRSSETSGTIVNSDLTIDPEATPQKLAILAYQFADALLVESLK